MKLLSLVLAFVLLCSCASARASLNATGVAADAAQAVMLVAYEREGNDAIDNSDSVQGAQEALARIRAMWSPTWRAFAMFRAVHGALADASDRGESVDVAALAAAYCALRAAAHAHASMPNLIGCIE